MRYCGQVGCRVLVERGYCKGHERKAWAPTVETMRIRGRRLQKMRQDLFRKHPLCVLCLQETPQRVTPATIRDHVIPLAEGGTDDNSNVQAICQEHSDLKTAKESQRGKARARI